MSGLFERALQGDANAVREIHGAIRGIARASCHRGGPGGVHVEWEDVAQDAARRFFGVAIFRFRESGSEMGYLRAIVRTTMLQMIRSETRRVRRETGVYADVPTTSHNPGPAIDVRRVLSRLPDECAEILRRVFLEGVSYATLAAELNMLESSVRTRVSRCLRRARGITEGDV